MRLSAKGLTEIPSHVQPALFIYHPAAPAHRLREEGTEGAQVPQRMRLSDD